MKRTAWFLVALAMVSLCGCETVKGVGRDITGASALLQNNMSKST